MLCNGSLGRTSLVAKGLESGQVYHPHPATSTRTDGTSRLALGRSGRLLRDKLPQATRTVETPKQPVYARERIRHQPLNRLAAIRQSQGRIRWHSTERTIKSFYRRFSSATSAPSKHRSAFPISKTSRAVACLPGRAPFASTLRPNLTGGALCRSAGGYGTGAGRIGGARYFSHGPAAPAQVINNVAQGFRAFWLGGQKLQYAGVDSRGEKKFKAASALQDEALRKLHSAPLVPSGSYLDFYVSPTITALGSFTTQNVAKSHRELPSLGDPCILKVLATDFARAFRDFTIINDDLRKLSDLGDLKISMPKDTIIRVHFPGCDIDTLCRLCEEIGIRRGLVHQDEDFNRLNCAEQYLQFPFAPESTAAQSITSFDAAVDPIDWQNMLTPRMTASPRCSTESVTSHELARMEAVEHSPWFSSPSGYSSWNESEDIDAKWYRGTEAGNTRPSPEGYDGLEGIYRFLEECDRARR